MNKATQSYAMIIGAMKCGTSSLFAYLAQHPQICASKKKEPEFFSEHQAHGADVESYDDLWRDQGGTVLLEGSTGYTKYPEEPLVPQRIDEYGLTPKFIYVVRDPIDRVESDYNSMRHNPATEAGEVLSENRIYRSRYFLQLRRFLEYFPDREQYVVVSLEDLKESPREVTNRLFDFLSLPQAKDIDFEVHNETGEPSQLEQWAADLGVYDLRKLVPEGLRDAVRQQLRDLTGSARHNLTSEEREFLRDTLRDDVRRLRDEFGVDVEDWDFPALS